MRGRSFLRQSARKPSVKNSTSTVDRSDTSVQIAGNENMVCNGVTALRTGELCLLTRPAKSSTCKHINHADYFTEVTGDNKNPVIARDMKTGNENHIRNHFFDILNDTNGSVSVENIPGSGLETVPVTTGDSMIDTKCNHSLIGASDMETSINIGPFKMDSLLIRAESCDGPVGVGDVKSVAEDCLSPIHGLTTCTNGNIGVETESKIGLDSAVEVPGEHVDPTVSEVIGSGSLKILSEDLLEVSDDITVRSTAKSVSVGAETNLFEVNALSEVSEDHDVQSVRNIDSVSDDLAAKRVCNGLGPFHLIADSSNSEINFQPVSVVCCNMHTSSCVSDGSAHDLQLNGHGGSFEVDGQECEKFRSGVLIGDPSFTAQSCFSEGDSELQVNELFPSNNLSSTWLSSEQSSETSKSSYLSDIDTDLLAQYDVQTVHEVSSEKNTVSCRTSHHYNSSDQKENSGKCTRLIRSRRMMTRNSKVYYMSNSLRSNHNIKKACMQCSGGTDPSVETAVTKQISRYRVLPEVSLNTNNERKETLFPTVSTLSSCTFNSPVDVSPVEVKRIETILWEGNIDEIIQLKDCSTNEGFSSENEVENSKQMLESYVQKIGNKTENSHVADVSDGNVGKNSRNGIELGRGDRRDTCPVSSRTRNMFRKIICQDGNAVTERSTLSASQVFAMTVNGAESTEHSNGIYSKKLARRLQREKRKRLSLSYRRKVASLASEGRNKHETDSNV